MKRKDRLPELLAPAGDRECLVAAVNGGADAVYVGGKAFGLRAFAKNFDTEDLIFAVRYCHLHGVKLYVTVNTLVYDREMKELSDYVHLLWRIGVDAVITADMGVIREIKRRVPKLEIHASTQLAVHNTAGVNEAFALGCKRVVVARELSLENIRAAVDNSEAEIEVFLHGALCVCHSGQCLMSSMVGGRSGNRGECAQPCRLPYNNSKYVLSLKDLSLASHVRELCESGVASLKIEGRMKSPEYVYHVTKIYRGLLDEQRDANKEEKKKLADVFSRGGFTDGYFIGKKDMPMTGIRTDTDKNASRSVQPADTELKRARVRAVVKIVLGEESEMTLIGEKGSFTVKGQIPTSAISSPLTAQAVKDRLSKMGQTGLSLSSEDIELTLDDGVNLPPSAINALRRDAAELYENEERETADTVYTSEPFIKRKENELTSALFLNADAYYLLISECGRIEGVDLSFVPVADYKGEAEGVYLPPVITDSEYGDVKKSAVRAAKMGARYALVGNVGAIELAKECGLIPLGDHRLNVTNRAAREVYRELGVQDMILSPELTLPMARDIGGGEIVYGRIPLMITERCFIKETFGCEGRKKAALTDRTGASFPLMCQPGHRNLILNSLPTYMGDRKEELWRYGIKHSHMIFTVESVREIKKILDAVKTGELLEYKVRRTGKR